MNLTEFINSSKSKKILFLTNKFILSDIELENIDECKLAIDLILDTLEGYLTYKLSEFKEYKNGKDIYYELIKTPYRQNNECIIFITSRNDWYNSLYFLDSDDYNDFIRIIETYENDPISLLGSINSIREPIIFSSINVLYEFIAYKFGIVDFSKIRTKLIDNLVNKGNDLN